LTARRALKSATGGLRGEKTTAGKIVCPSLKEGVRFIREEDHRDFHRGMDAEREKKPSPSS